MQLFPVFTTEGALIMKSISKILLVCAVAVSAIALSGASAEAAKKKGKSAACTPGALCTAACVGAQCKLNVCGGDGKLYQAMITPFCWTPGCPAKC
jgi:hypothetical protein